MFAQGLAIWSFRFSRGPLPVTAACKPAPPPQPPLRLRTLCRPSSPSPTRLFSITPCSLHSAARRDRHQGRGCQPREPDTRQAGRSRARGPRFLAGRSREDRSVPGRWYGGIHGVDKYHIGNLRALHRKSQRGRDTLAEVSCRQASEARQGRRAASGRR